MQQEVVISSDGLIDDPIYVKLLVLYDIHTIASVIEGREGHAANKGA